MFENQSFAPDHEKEEKNCPACAVVGGSGEGKSTMIAGMAYPDFQGGMYLFVGNGNTTACMSKTFINPKLYTADVLVEGIKDKEEIQVEVGRHMKASLVPELKNCISSRPKRESEHDSFYAASISKRLSPVDATFRIEKLLRGYESSWARYQEIMTSILKFVDQQADDSFRNNYFDRLKSDKTEANRMIDTLVDQKLFPEVGDDNNVEDAKKSKFADDLMAELSNLIYDKAIDCLQRAGFEVDGGAQTAYACGKNAEEFKTCVQAVTNSLKEQAPSAACVIKEMKLRVPGPGLRMDGYSGETAYCVYDVVGFDNDGIGRIPERVREALLTPVLYDAIIYVRSAVSADSKNRDYLTAIQQSVRPSKLIVAVTNLDHANTFEQEEEPTGQDVQNQISELKTSTLSLIESVIDKDCRVKLPEKPDIICFANTLRKNRLGEEATAFLEANDPYRLLRASIAKAYVQVRRKIKSHNIASNQTDKFLEPKEPVCEIIGQIIDNLTTSVNAEYSELRDRSSKLHHWTVDAVLWNLYNGRAHVSYAQVWENVIIHTFSDFLDICMKNLTPSKLATGVEIREDLDRVKREFESNLRMELDRVARKIILETQNGTQPSDCKQMILKLARTPKYNKWKIFDDLRKYLLNAVSQQDYLELLLDTAVINANKTTYTRLFM